MPFFFTRDFCHDTSSPISISLVAKRHSFGFPSQSSTLILALASFASLSFTYCRIWSTQEAASMLKCIENTWRKNINSYYIYMYMIYINITHTISFLAIHSDKLNSLPVFFSLMGEMKHHVRWIILCESYSSFFWSDVLTTILQ